MTQKNSDIHLDLLYSQNLSHYHTHHTASSSSILMISELLTAHCLLHHTVRPGRIIIGLIIRLLPAAAAAASASAWRLASSSAAIRSASSCSISACCCCKKIRVLSSLLLCICDLILTVCGSSTASHPAVPEGSVTSLRTPASCLLIQPSHCSVLFLQLLYLLNGIRIHFSRLFLSCSYIFCVYSSSCKKICTDCLHSASSGTRHHFRLSRIDTEYAFSLHRTVFLLLSVLCQGPVLFSRSQSLYWKYLSLKCLYIDHHIYKIGIQCWRSRPPAAASDAECTQVEHM